MTAGTVEPAPARPAPGQRWLARGAFAAVLASVVVLVASEGAIGLTLLDAGLPSCAVRPNCASDTSPSETPPDAVAAVDIGRTMRAFRG